MALLQKHRSVSFVLRSALLLLPIIAPSVTAASTHRFACPATAPASLPHPGARLEGAEVLSYAPNEKIDLDAPPSLMPDERGVWDFADSQDEVQELWCEYKGNPRAAMRLGPMHLKRCAYSGSDEKHKPGEPLTAWCD
jgi:hypothetical protein